MTLFRKGGDRPERDLIPVCCYDPDSDCFLMRNGSAMDLLRLRSSDLFRAREEDLRLQITRLSAFFRNWGRDCKLLALNLPTDTSLQQQYVRTLLSRPMKAARRELLLRRQEELCWISENSVDRSYYLVLFAQDAKALAGDRQELSLLRHGLCERIGQSEKEAVLYRFHNRLRPAGERSLPPEQVPALKYRHGVLKGDPALLRRIQPVSGVSFRPARFYETGDGYGCCVHVFAYPKTVRDLWLYPLFHLPQAITMLDIHAEDRQKVLQSVNRNLKEHRVRFYTAREDVEQMDAENSYQDQQELYEDLRLGESVLTITMRIYLAEKTEKQLESRVSEVFRELRSRSFSAAVFLNETRQEYGAFYESYSLQQQALYRRPGQALTSGALAAGYPFHFTSHQDPCGLYYGYTGNSGGKVLLDLFRKTRDRKSYDSVVLGRMGSGKSTLLKKMAQDMIARGNRVRGFDQTGEWEAFVQKYGGKRIALDGSAGRINPFEIFRASDTEQVSWLLHLSKLRTIYGCLAPDSDSLEAAEFERLCRRLYEQWGIVSKDGSVEKVTGLSPEAYPTFRDFYILAAKERRDLISRRMTVSERESLRERLQRLERIELVCENVVMTYGDLLDGHTTVENLMEEQVVFFDIRSLRSMKAEIFEAQMFNILTLCWDNCVACGEPMKRKWESGETDFAGITRFLIIMDEAHRLINSQRLQSVRQVLSYIREARKFFGGMVLASQSIRDFIREDAGSEAVSLMTSLFELMQYKFLFQQDSNALDLLRRVFQGALTETELSGIPRLEMGETILLLDSSHHSCQFTVDVSREDLQLYRGGA